MDNAQNREKVGAKAKKKRKQLFSLF